MMRSYHHGGLRDALLVAVAEVLRDDGVGGLSLRSVARRAGVSHAAPAHHFPSKAALLTAFATRGFERMGEAVAQELASSSPEDGPAALRACGRG
jgi:AcrR family transcriptional regulator